MGFSRHYTKDETFMDLPVATDLRRNLVCDTAALNSIKRMMDNGTATDKEAEIVRLDVSLPASKDGGNDVFKAAQADVMKYFRRRDGKIKYVAYKHGEEGRNVYRIAIVAPKGNAEELVDRTEKVFNHKLMKNEGKEGIIVKAGCVIPFSDANKDSFREAFREASTIAQVKLPDEETKVLFTSNI